MLNNFLKNFKETHPNTFTITLAFVMALFSYLYMAVSFAEYESGEFGILQRCLYIAALFLLMNDVLIGAQMASNGNRNLRHAEFWILAFYQAYVWMLFMVLLNWNGEDRLLVTFSIFGIGAAFFGASLAWLAKEASPAAHLNLARPLTSRSVGKLYYLWPFILIAVIIALLTSPPPQGWEPNWLFFQFIFLGSLCPLYQPNNVHYWRNSLPRLLGYSLLVVSLFFS